MRVRNALIAAVVGTSAMLQLGGPASAAPFTPVIDEFWIVRNGTEIFRDSFSDGIVPASGPDGATTYFTAAQAGLAGMTIPLILERLGVDPAVASGVFLTTVTDVVGFFTFLGLATWLIL